jgi:hypothetical protein
MAMVLGGLKSFHIFCVKISPLRPLAKKHNTEKGRGLLLRRFIRNSLFDKNKKEKKQNPRKKRK